MLCQIWNKKPILYHRILLAIEWKEIQNKANPFTNTTSLTGFTQQKLHKHIREGQEIGGVYNGQLCSFLKLPISAYQHQKKRLKTKITTNYIRGKTVCISNTLSTSKWVPKSALTYSHIFPKFYFF